MNIPIDWEYPNKSRCIPNKKYPVIFTQIPAESNDDPQGGESPLAKSHTIFFWLRLDIYHILNCWNFYVLFTKSGSFRIVTMSSPWLVFSFLAEIPFSMFQGSKTSAYDRLQLVGRTLLSAFHHVLRAYRCCAMGIFWCFFHRMIRFWSEMVCSWNELY